MTRASPPSLLALLLTTVLVGGCSDGDTDPTEPGPLMAGAASVVVTPLVETFTDLNDSGWWEPGEPFEDLDGDGVLEQVWIAGFSSGRDAWGVHDDLYARALVVQKDELRIGIVSVDWIGVLYDDAMWLQQLAAEAGLEFDHLILTSTHNHEAIDTLGIWGPDLLTPGRNQAYMEASFASIVDALQDCVDQLAPVRIIAGVTQTENLVHDSRLPEAKDETLVALRFERVADAQALAVVVHWGNHPEALGGDNRYLTADFPASMLASLEQAHPGATAIYWQGMVGGLMNPLHVDVTDEQGQLVPDDSFEKAERLGILVAEKALAALEQGQDATGNGLLAFERRELLLPVDNPEMQLASQIGLFARTFYDADNREADPGLPELYIRSEVNAMSLGEVRIATVPGELYPELGLVGPEGQWYYEAPQDPGADFQGVECVAPIQTSMGDTPYKMIIGLANDELGYLIPKCQYDREAPHAYGRDRGQYGEGFCPGPDVSPMLVRGLAEAFESLAQKSTP